MKAAQCSLQLATYESRLDSTSVGTSPAPCDLIFKSRPSPLSRSTTMPTERAGVSTPSSNSYNFGAKYTQYTVTMFLIDVSSSMGSICTGGKMTHLECALQFVKLKVQEMVQDIRSFFLQLFIYLFSRFSMAERQINVVSYCLALRV